MKSPEQKMFPFFISYLIPFLVVLGMIMGDAWTFLPVFVLFVIVPILEIFMKGSTANPNKYEEIQWRDYPGFSYLLWGHVLSQLVVIFMFLTYISEFEPSTLELIGATLSTGIMFGAIGITVAHELIHRSNESDQWMGKFLLLTTNYLHFFLEHIHGHHRNVATDSDPATARIGEPIYTFWFRSVLGSYLSAWKIAGHLCEKENINPNSMKNPMMQYTVAALVYNVLIVLAVGPDSYLWYLLASIIGFTLLEIVNYIEHYGLFRHEGEDGAMEKIEAHHSWSSNNTFSRLFLFELTRHSDHHLNASRPYQILRHIENSPQHPTGYPGMILMTLIPPLWFSVMNPRALTVVRTSPEEVISLNAEEKKFKELDF